MGTPLKATCFSFSDNQTNGSYHPLKALVSQCQSQYTEYSQQHSSYGGGQERLSKGIEILLNAATNINIKSPEGITTLMLAVAYDNDKAVAVLLNTTAVQDQDGSTALHVAVEGGYTAITKMLLVSGALVTIIDNNGDTPLDVALCNSGYETVR